MVQYEKSLCKPENTWVWTPSICGRFRCRGTYVVCDPSAEEVRAGGSELPGQSAHSNGRTPCLVKDLVSGNKVEGQCDGLVVRWGVLPRPTA